MFARLKLKVSSDKFQLLIDRIKSDIELRDFSRSLYDLFKRLPYVTVSFLVSEIEKTEEEILSLLLPFLKNQILVLMYELVCPYCSITVETSPNEEDLLKNKKMKCIDIECQNDFLAKKQHIYVQIHPTKEWERLTNFFRYPKKETKITQCIQT